MLPANIIIANQKLSRYVDSINRQEYIYPANYVKMRYLENHDQDRARAIIRGEEALRNWTAFLYFQKGITMLYAGQENQDGKKPDLFHKDVINMDAGRDMSDLLRRLYQIKKMPIVVGSSYHLTACDELGAVVGEHREIRGKGRLLGVFSFEEKEGQIEVGIGVGRFFIHVPAAEPEIVCGVAGATDRIDLRNK